MNTDSPGKTFKASLLPAVLVIAILSFGREFFVPLALALLIAFLLRPLVTRLERCHLGRVGSVLAATLFALLVVAGVGYIVGGQLFELANELPKYKGHLSEKVAALKVPKDGALAKAKETLQELTKEITSEGMPAATGLPKTKGNPAEGGTQTPTPVAVVSMPASPDQANSGDGGLRTLTNFVAPLLGPLGMATLVVVFVVFMLLEREDLRDRIIHLGGRGHLQLTTQALDDATHRVSKYLLAQVLVNLSYGVPIGLGLMWIGIPNAFLWGLLATVLRFVPYIGAWISAMFPIILSMAVSSSWATPALTIGLFVVVEILAGYVFEPWLYGASTGLTSIAVVLAAAFWTWLWGPIGLLLATPLTVCLAVLGKHVPQLTYLDVLLGDRPPIAPEDRFYQRLLAGDEDEGIMIAERYLETHSLGETYEQLLVPALRLAEEDCQRGVLMEGSCSRVQELIRDLIRDLGETPPALPDSAPPDLICLPASTIADEVTALMLSRLLACCGVNAKIVPARKLASEMMDEAAAAETRLFCVSVMPSGSTRHGLYVAKRLRERLPEARILVGVWGEPPADERGRLRRFQQVKVEGVVTSLQEMVKDIAATAKVRPDAVASVTAKPSTEKEEVVEGGAVWATAVK